MPVRPPMSERVKPKPGRHPVHDAIGEAVQDWILNGRSQNQLAKASGLAPGAIRQKIVGTTRWSIEDCYALQEAGVDVPEVIKGFRCYDNEAQSIRISPRSGFIQFLLEDGNEVLAYKNLKTEDAIRLYKALGAAIHMSREKK